VSKKHKHHQATAWSPVELKPRIERARREGRFQQALDLAKQLHKYEPTPAHLELLKDVYLGRARQLRGQGQLRDAQTVLEVALRLDGENPSWLERLAEEMALCGEVRQALALSERLHDPSVVGRILGHVADTVMQRQAAGRADLPPALQAECDRIVQAFEQVESGQDDAARETLQGIGLRSPFLEWKLLLRGLQAYWQNEDVRALENWQRLTAERLPARLAAPFRSQIDKAFQAAQPPATQTVLQKQFDRQQGSTLLVHLRTLRATLADKTKLSAAFRQVEALLPALREEAPHLLPRLAACFYWAILDTGPDDVLRYQRVFGKPPDDPNFHRLYALAYEKGDDLTKAHVHWQQYEMEIAANPESWPNGQAVHARALIWQHLGQNAASVATAGRGQRRNPFPLFGEPEPERPLDPSAEKCFQKSLELDAEQLETHEALVGHHLEAKREGKAEKAARQLLKQFPEHAPTLELLSDLRLKHGDYAEALELIEQAVKGNPLDRRLRYKLSAAQLLHARSLGEAGDFEGARRGFQTAIELSGGSDNGVIRARWAAAEFKAGDVNRAEELLEQARNAAPAPVGIAFLLLTEIIRLKLDRKLKTRFDQEFKQGLAEPPSAAATVFLVRILAGFHLGGIAYVGQKTHNQKILAYVNKARLVQFTESQYEELIQSLLDLEAFTRARQVSQQARVKFMNNPMFPYFNAMSYLLGKDRRVHHWRLTPLLQAAQRLAQALPPDERRDRLLADIDKHLRELNPFGMELLERLFDPGGAANDFYDDDDAW
jgi:tetratricopeptide (TPR) repeat protein